MKIMINAFVKAFFIVILLFLALGVVQCVVEPDNDQVSYYIDIIEEEALKRGHVIQLNKIPVVFTDNVSWNGKNIIGVCMFNMVTQQRNIFIHSKYWQGASNNSRLMLLTHEVGHCYFNLEHDNNSFNIMNSFMSEDVRITKELWDDFFKRAYPYKILPIPQD